jgi:HEAT repeat protein
MACVALVVCSGFENEQDDIHVPPKPQQSAAPASAQPTQQTLAEVLGAAGLKPAADAVRDLDQAITSYAVLNDRDVYLIAYYWNLPSGMLEDPLRVLSFNRQTAEWKSAQLILGSDQISHAECLGSVLRAHAVRSAFLLDTHINPSAGCLVILERNLAFRNALYGWYLATLNGSQIVFQRSEVHFAAVHPAELAAIDPDERIRSAARSWLAAWSGKPSDLDFSGIVDALIATYQSKAPPDTMVKIARMLSQPGRPRVTRFMRAAVHAPNPEIEEIATRYLSVYRGVGEATPARKIRQPRTTEQKIAFLEKLGKPREDNDNANAIRYLADPVERVRVSAASTLGRIDAASMNGQDEPGPGSEKAPPALVKALKDSSPNVRAAAAQALGDIRTNEAQDSLVGALQDNDERVRLAAATALEYLPTDAAVNGLSQIHKDPTSSAELKQQAVATLSTICNPASLPVFLEELEVNGVNPPDTVGYGLSCVLKKKPDPSAFEPIRKALEAERPRPQPSLVVALGETKNPHAFPALAELLQSPNSVTRRAAAEALGGLGDVRAVGPLAQVLADNEVSIYAAAALAEFSDFTAPPELLAILANPDPTVRLHGSRALARSRDPKAIEALISAMPKEPLAISALGESACKQAVVALLAFLQNPANKSDQRSTAAASLGKLGDLRAVEPLIATLNEDNMSITMSASSALGQLKDKRAIEPLKQAYARWSNGQREYADSVKGSIVQALSQLGVTDFVKIATGMPEH